MKVNWRFLLAALLVQFMALPSHALDDYTLELYENYCQACHSSTESGAPLAFDARAWAERNKKGAAVLLENTIKGIGNMPPMGMCMECMEEDLQDLISYMSQAQ
jgi:cytochrome c5